MGEICSTLARYENAKDIFALKSEGKNQSGDAGENVKNLLLKLTLQIEFWDVDWNRWWTFETITLRFHKNYEFLGNLKDRQLPKSDPASWSQLIVFRNVISRVKQNFNKRSNHTKTGLNI
jgi:hypothetical protein